MATQSVLNHDVYYCGMCHDQYIQYTDKKEDWIGCETCDTWFHFVCVGVTTDATPDRFYCEKCKED